MVIASSLFADRSKQRMQAQANPIVEIVLSQPTATRGNIITADVYVRNAVNIARADIGISVTTQCLKIVDRQQDGYLSSSTEGGPLFAIFPIA